MILPFYMQWSEPWFYFTVDFLSKAWDDEKMKCFHFRISLLSTWLNQENNMFISCILNIKQRKGCMNPSLPSHHGQPSLKIAHVKPPESKANKTQFHGVSCFVFTRCKTHGPNLCHCNLPGSRHLNHQDCSSTFQGVVCNPVAKSSEGTSSHEGSLANRM